MLGIFSPSAPAAAWFPRRLEQAAMNAQTQLGLRTRYGDAACMASGWVSASADLRAEDLHHLSRAPEVKGLVAAIGGHHTAQMFPYLDWDRLAGARKIVIGASDAGLLPLAMYVQTGLVGIYGPTWVASWGEYPAMPEYTVEGIRRVLCTPAAPGLVSIAPKWTDEFIDWSTRDDQTRPRRWAANAGPVWLRRGSAEGILLGGRLESLEHLRGTEYWPDWHGALFFFELSEELPSPARVDAILGDYANMGVFDQISGVLVGRLYRYPAEERETLFDVIRFWTAPRRLPVLAECDFGHTDPVFPIPIGIRGRLDADGFHLLEEVVE